MSTRKSFDFIRNRSSRKLTGQRVRPGGRMLDWEALEDRTMLSTIIWTNKGVTSGPNSDNFNQVFGNLATQARNVIAADIADWQRVISNFNPKFERAKTGISTRGNGLRRIRFPVSGYISINFSAAACNGSASVS